MLEDHELLRRYAEENSEEAFAELVGRRIGLVYAVALRHTRDAHRAEDATQRVFTDLARKAAQLARRPVLVGWLHRSARFAASDAVRVESRRQAREQEAHTMQQIEREAPEPDWNQIRPVLDEVLSEMEERDRDAVLLRFFDGQPFADIGAKLRLSENAARMRVERALDKLHTALARRGVTSTATALGVALAQQAGIAAPAGLAASVTGAALSGAASSFCFVGIPKIVTGIAVVVAIGAVGFGLFESEQVRQAKVAVDSLTQEPGQKREQLQKLEARVRSEEEAVNAAKTTKVGVNVVGAVLKPGFVSFPDEQGLTLVDAIVGAGGFNRSADKRQVSLRRTSPDGKNEIFIVDVDAIIKGKTDERWPLRPGDVILVP